MRKISLLICCVVLLGLSVGAQNPSGSITGTLVDSSGNKSLSAATVSLLLEKDSSLVTYLLTDSNGLFSIKDLGNDQYRVVISYQGFVPYEKTCIISEETRTVNLGNIHMRIDPNSMDEVVLISNVPIQIKGDTTQFNASAFKTVPNANAEDLFKKLPGVEVDVDGNVRAQGEEVTKIFVDGKEFFGKDPKMATKNITAEMIQSVQVYDDMSDQAKFTRIDDGSRTKTINIVLKKNRRKGYFGKAVAGMGNDSRYQSSLNSSHFDEERRISLVGSSNNINKQGFGGGRAAANTPANTRGNIAGIGITTATAIGLNYTNKIGKKVDITGSYNYTETNNRRQQTTYRESTFFNDSSARTRSPCAR